MYEFFIYDKFKKKPKRENYDEPEEKIPTGDIVFVALYLVIFAMAIYRALQVKNKALHLLFSTISPVIYLICYHLVPEFKDT